MSQTASKPNQVFAAPTALRDRIGPRFGRIDPAAVAKAEAALKGLSSQFGQWLNEEVERLEVAREAIHASGPTAKAFDQLFTRAHDLKGLGSTYEFPLISRISGSLCKLLGDGDARATTSMALVDAHVQTIRAAVRDNIRDSENPVGAALAGELERRTAEYLSTKG